MRALTAMVDVDNTLFDYASPLYMVMRRDGINIPGPAFWNKWAYFYPDYMTSKVAHEYFDEIHTRQLEYEPYEDARFFLANLMENYKVIIVSHRRAHQCELLRDWVELNKLPYDEVKCSNDKTRMFDSGMFDLVVDDCPATLEAAHKHGMDAYGLIKPWNMDCRYGVLLPTLTDILRSIEVVKRF